MFIAYIVSWLRTCSWCLHPVEIVLLQVLRKLLLLFVQQPVVARTAIHCHCCRTSLLSPVITSLCVADRSMPCASRQRTCGCGKILNGFNPAGSAGSHLKTSSASLLCGSHLGRGSPTCWLYSVDMGQSCIQMSLVFLRWCLVGSYRALIGFSVRTFL